MVLSRLYWQEHLCWRVHNEVQRLPIIRIHRHCYSVMGDIVTIKEKMQWLIDHGELSYSGGFNDMESFANAYRHVNWRSKSNTCSFMATGDGKRDLIFKMFELVKEQLYQLTTHGK